MFNAVLTEWCDLFAVADYPMAIAIVKKRNHFHYTTNANKAQVVFAKQTALFNDNWNDERRGLIQFLCDRD